MRNKSSKKPEPRRKRSVSTARPDQARFERKVAEFKAELEKLPADRREQLERELEEHP